MYLQFSPRAIGGIVLRFLIHDWSSGIGQGNQRGSREKGGEEGKRSEGGTHVFPRAVPIRNYQSVRYTTLCLVEQGRVNGREEANLAAPRRRVKFDQL